MMNDKQRQNIQAYVDLAALYHQSMIDFAAAIDVKGMVDRADTIEELDEILYALVPFDIHCPANERFYIVKKLQKMGAFEEKRS